MADRLVDKINPRTILYVLCLLALRPSYLLAETPSALSLAPRLASRHAPALSAKITRLPLYFVENRGQVDARAHYYVHGADKLMYFGSHGVTMVLANTAQAPAHALAGERLAAMSDGSAGASSSRATVTLEFVGATPTVKPAGEDATPARFSYFTGSRENWIVGSKSFSRLIYTDLWPGIDLIYTASRDRLKYMFVVKPGADPRTIRLRYRGAEGLSLNQDGALLVRTWAQNFNDDPPAAHQEIGGAIKSVVAAYMLLGGDANAGYSYGFKIDDYDHAETLVIDPAIMVYSGFIGGSGDDRGNGIAVDAAGNAYVTGETNSIQSSFPSSGGPDVSQNGVVDAFVAKIDPTGTQLLYAGFIGGAADDRGRAIAVDASGNAYVTGETNSNQTTFPVTVGPDLIHNGVTDAFVAKINPTGTNLVYAGYLGGTGNDRGMGIAVDSSNRAYVTGDTDSSGTSFPGGGGFGGLTTFDSTHNSGIDAFVVRVAENGATLEYAGYIGGLGTDRGLAIAVDGSNRAYVTGETDSSNATFPTGLGFGGLTSFDASQNGGVDGFVARLAANGQNLEYAGYIGGSATDRGSGIAVDGAGNAYLTGETGSSEATFPDGAGLGSLPGPGQTHGGGTDAFAAKINSAGSALTFAGYIGGSADERGNGIAIMPDCASNCDSFIVGETASNQATFPVLDGPDLTHNGGVDAFVARIASNGSLALAGYIGGTGDDRGKGIALDALGAVYLTGETNSTQPSFPLQGSLDSTQNLGVDAFVAKFCITECVDLVLVAGDSPDPATLGANITYTITVTNHGPDNATDVELTDVLPSGVGLVSATPSVGSCSGSGTIVCGLGDLVNGASATVTIVVSTAAVGKLTNTATVSSEQTDTDATNNIEREQTVVTLPNLRVKSLGAAAAAIPGANVTVSDTTSNRGKLGAGASITRFYLSRDSRFDGADVELGSRAIPPLAARQSSSGTTIVTIPAGTELARYFIIGVADADSVVAETKEKNSKARSFTVALPDLIVAALNAPRSVAAGASIAIKDQVRNDAPVSAAASTIQYLLSSDALLDGGDAPIGSRSVPGLGAKGRNSGAATISIPAGTAPGPYFILAVSDSAGVVDEANEGNNVRAKAITVTP
ncbi:MAG TPA: SBBP repeat-containing protein [Candidatus Binatia bacterium]|nr:SBBP repeat-containing protein [Candidatus Binatia bacterium]